LGPLPEPPRDEEEVMKLGKALQLYVGLDDAIDSLPYRTLDSLPKQLLPALQEVYITSLSEIFSRTSHEGDYPQSSATGLMLLALYLIIYPKNYPQIGELIISPFNALDNLCIKEFI
jgi:hypothetical protein